MAKESGVIRPLETRDFQKLAVYLEEKTGGEQNREDWLDLFGYWWEKNPAMEPHIPMGWILVSADDRVGGFLGNIPLRYVLNGKEVTVCSGTSWFVDEPYRHKSLDFLNRFLKQKHPLLNTTPIDAVHKIFLRLGFKELARPWLQVEGILPVHCSSFWDFFVHKRFADKSFFQPLRWLSPLMGAGIHLVLHLGRLIRCPGSAPYTTRQISWFTDRTAIMPDRFRTDFSFYAQRTPETLNWYFFSTERLKGKRRVLEVLAGKESIGYVAVKKVEKLEHGGSFGYYEVADLALDRAEPEVYMALFKGLAAMAKKESRPIAFIRMSPFAPGLEQSMKRFGFLQQQVTFRYLHRGLGTDLQESAIHATPLDGDRCFFP